MYFIRKQVLLFLPAIAICSISFSQAKWINADSAFQPLPSSVHVWFTNTPVDTSGFIAYYFEADLKDRNLEFTVDTTLNRRLTPYQFYQKNNSALAIVNCTFFSFETNRSLNTVIKNKKLLAYNNHSVPGKGKDTLTYRHVLSSAIGISAKRKPDVAWVYTDSIHKDAYALQFPVNVIKDSIRSHSLGYFIRNTSIAVGDYSGDHGRMYSQLKKWKMKTAVGGGPVLVQNGEIKITNDEELKFAGKAINDKHPRTAMGYTKDGKLIILVIQGRSESSSGASLIQEAQLLKDIGCTEAINLDGGGSSCLLVNGKETIKPSDKEGERPVPAVFMIRSK
ncbi:MAG: phosphodiester glycosidase family protein [Bacteroidetes bacterium]|nr:phosphodiester glycosidase family protein [Bacteroidota bacterium]